MLWKYWLIPDKVQWPGVEVVVGGGRWFVCQRRHRRPEFTVARPGSEHR